MADDNVELVRDAYGAFARGDIPAVMSAFAQDIEWNVPAVLPHGARGQGHEEVGRFFENLGATWEGFTLELDDLVGSGDRVFAVGRAQGSLEGKQAGYRFVHVWTVGDGTGARFDEYVDQSPRSTAVEPRLPLAGGLVRHPGGGCEPRLRPVVPDRQSTLAG
jgi:uncharacterized protein